MASQYNQKIVAAQPWIGYHPTAGVPKKEIPASAAFVLAW